MEFPETRYAWNGSVALAYQVIGDGPDSIFSTSRGAALTST